MPPSDFMASNQFRSYHQGRQSRGKRHDSRRSRAHSKPPIIPPPLVQDSLQSQIDQTPYGDKTPGDTYLGEATSSYVDPHSSNNQPKAQPIT